MEKFIDEILVGKANVIERCAARVREEYVGYESEFETNFTKQDSVILNLQRASEAAIDAANHLIKVKRLGVPQTSREAFETLINAGLLDKNLGEQLQKMVGFRNIAVHDYTSLNLKVVRKIIETRLSDFEKFAAWLLEQGQTESKSNN
ncbi:MAG: DUF86 domain-containing protein [Chloroherpetonaceae bacterium]